MPDPQPLPDSAGAKHRATDDRPLGVTYRIPHAPRHRVANVASYPDLDAYLRAATHHHPVTFDSPHGVIARADHDDAFFEALRARNRAVHGPDASEQRYRPE